jgi:hypothetical protein
MRKNTPGRCKKPSWAIISATGEKLKSEISLLLAVAKACWWRTKIAQWFFWVIVALRARARGGGANLGVGPDARGETPHNTTASSIGVNAGVGP